MNKTYKILLTIPSVLATVYMFTFWFPTKFQWLVFPMEQYYLQIGIIQTLVIIQVIVLLKKLWSFKEIKKSKKTEWTWLLILFTFITNFIFIWFEVDELNEKNKGS